MCTYMYTCMQLSIYTYYVCICINSCGDLCVLVQVTTALKETFDRYSERAAAEGSPWVLKPEVVFLRLDTYRERNAALASVTNTALQFSKLEKLEICGSKGGVQRDGRRGKQPADSRRTEARRG